MIIMHTLRMLADVSFYYAFAGFFCAKYGGGGAVFLAAAVQCLCYGLSSQGGSSRGKRLVWFLPVILSWLFVTGSAADCLLLVPAAVYMGWLVWKGDYTLSQNRQQRIFAAAWKVLPAAACLFAIFGGYEPVAGVTIPFSVMMLASSILLMRSLRHDKGVYCQKKYQAVNVAVVAAVLAVSRLMSSSMAMELYRSALQGLYYIIITPFSWLLMLLMNGLSEVIHIAKGEGGRSSGEEVVVHLKELAPLDTSQAESILPGSAKWFFAAAGIAAVILLVFFFFRWLQKKGPVDETAGAGLEIRQVLERKAAPQNENSSPVRKVRNLYRKYLRQCVSRGVTVKKSTTSMEVHHQVRNLTDVDEKTAEEIRQLYISARYAGQADRESVRNMKALCSQVKKTGK